MTDDPGSTDPTVAAVHRCILTVCPDVPAASLRPEASLQELGCNSVDRADVLTMAMHELGVAVPVAELARARDIAMLTDLLRRHG